MTHITDRDSVESLLAEDGVDLEPFSWSVGGETYREGSSQPWRSHHESGVIHAEGPYPALIKLITGFGRHEVGDSTIELLPDGDREIVLSIAPAHGERDE